MTFLPGMGEGFHADLLSLEVPACLKGMGPDLDMFFGRMIFKLAKNAHKSTPTKRDVYAMMALMMKEQAEFITQYEENPYDDNNLSELADIANFAFLIWLAVMKVMTHEAYLKRNDDAGPRTEVDDYTEPAFSIGRRA